MGPNSRYHTRSRCADPYLGEVREADAPVFQLPRAGLGGLVGGPGGDTRESEAQPQAAPRFHRTRAPPGASFEAFRLKTITVQKGQQLPWLRISGFDPEGDIPHLSLVDFRADRDNKTR